MDTTEADKLVKELAAGFEILQEEYQKLFGRHQALERKLATAREQYNELSKLYGTGSAATPPLSLSPPSPIAKHDTAAPSSTSDILGNRPDQASKDAAARVRLATCAAARLRPGLPQPSSVNAQGVKIWSGPSADNVNVLSSGSVMPSISESPLEQDFTIEGTPSKLGCPFASMQGKRLSSHAASVLSRYKPGGSAAGAPSSTALSSVSRVNGKESFGSQRGSHRASFPDPIKAEICGLSDHDGAPTEPAEPAKCPVPTQDPADAEAGVCPIRFLDQHSPEEVATYFEKHKHELPRSHEICVKRYQSNEAQIRELDSKYGNLVSMIQGLGAKHQSMLPNEPADEDEEVILLDGEDAEKVRQWASSVSPPPQAEDALSTAAQGGEANVARSEPADSDTGEERQQHFARPLRDIRVGESPSRPWGISVPARYLEKVAGNESDTSSQPARIPSSHEHAPPPFQAEDMKPKAVDAKPAGKCPFGFDQMPKATPSGLAEAGMKPTHKPVEPTAADPATVPSKPAKPPSIAFISPSTGVEAGTSKTSLLANSARQMVFNGPVFIGYSAEDAAKILRDSGLGRSAGDAARP